ncbi:MAG: hypothetical protein NTU72_08230 [Fimbriimonadales bacterium]|nr:hypothetical protein [Fimbriimonadales bacterium]
MPLNLSVSTDSVTVEPGQAAPLAILVENDSTTEDTVEIGILGLDGEWVIIPVSQIELRPNDKQEVKVFFKPPRSSESSAGSFPFVVKVRSLTNSDQRTSGGMLTIKPFHSLSVELNPRRGVITSTKQNNVFTATIMNMGNSEHDVQLSADDPEEACTYDFDDEQVTLRPGQQMDVDFAVTPKKKSPLGSSRLVGFIVTARSTSVKGVASTVQGQLEIRPFFTPMKLVFATLVMILLGIFWLTQPKPATIRLEVLGPKKVYQGTKVTVRWVAENSNAVKILASGEVVQENAAPEGSVEVEARLLGTLKIQGVAFRDQRESEPATADVEVVLAPVVPDPEILVFKPSSLEVRKGEKVTLEYSFNAAVTKAILAPNQIELDLNLNTIVVEPSVVGDNEFTIVVENAQKKIQKKSLRIKMVDSSLASITRFEADPVTGDAGNYATVIHWVTLNADRVELLVNGKALSVESEGDPEIPIVGKTVFKLRALDVNGKVVEKVLTVDPDKKDDPGTVDLIREGEGTIKTPTTQPVDPKTSPGKGGKGAGTKSSGPRAPGQ